MKARRGTTIDVDSLAEWERRLAHGVRSIGGWRLHGVDLSEQSEQVAGLDVAGATFIGCRMPTRTEAALRAGGATVYDLPPDVPVDTFRTSLYTPDELYSGLSDGGSYEQTLDARTYAWSRLPGDTESSMAMTLHDHAVDDALSRWTEDRSMVGVMGGHHLVRGSVDYATAAALGHALGGRHTVATGGGPGAMEAANLGAFLPDAAGLDEALSRLGAVPGFRPVNDWARLALQVAHETAAGRPSLGIPTWYYGHEPPNAFATAIAKYFRNAQREAVLLQVCNAGIVFLPGAGGTVQEIFQDACENYYADESSVAPMVLLGRRYWTETLPAWPLLQALARGRPMESEVHLVDDVSEALALLS